MQPLQADWADVRLASAVLFGPAPKQQIGWIRLVATDFQSGKQPRWLRCRKGFDVMTCRLQHKEGRLFARGCVKSRAL
ncbi:hypothetical protein ABXW19_11580, partial [Streptococcus suis]